MGKALTTYLQDHLAGAMHAIELLKAIRDHYAGKPLGRFASELLIDIEADRDVLARLTENTGGASGGPKEWASWLAEKVSRLKLKHDSGDGLGTFEALEFLVLGIHGKRALACPGGCCPLRLSTIRDRFRESHCARGKSARKGGGRTTELRTRRSGSSGGTLDDKRPTLKP